MKKEIKPNAVRRAIREGREAGKTDLEIYRDLSQVYFDRQALALLISATTTPRLKTKYHAVNTFLVVWLGIGALSKIFNVVYTVLLTGMISWLLSIFLYAGLSVFFMIQIGRYNGQIYRTCALIAFLGIALSIWQARTNWEAIFSAGYSLTIVALCLFLSKALFPNYAPGKLQKNKEGDYMW